MIRVFIVDDHPLFREGLGFLLSQIDNIQVVGEASNGKEFIDIIGNIDVPDIILMDITMPVMDGIEACKTATDKYPGIKIIALSMNNEQEHYLKMIQSGAKGFVQKQAEKAELQKAIEEVNLGGTYFPEDLLRKIIIKISGNGQMELRTKNGYDISEREFEVLSHICQGFTNAEIAERMFLSQKTIEGHRASLLAKTDTKNSAHLVMFSIKNGLLKI